MLPSQTTGRSIMVVFAVWDRAVRVRFPAPRPIETGKCDFTTIFVFVKKLTL